ncbi:MAG: hypothetical protein WBA87_14420 [Microbacterium sp.]
MLPASVALCSNPHRDEPGGAERKESLMNTVVVAPTTADILPVEATRS